MVMSEGKAGEYDHPYRLLVDKIGDDTITNPGGMFAQMVLATGLETAQSLFEIAHQQYYKSIEKFPETHEGGVDPKSPGRGFASPKSLPEPASPKA